MNVWGLKTWQKHFGSDARRGLRVRVQKGVDPNVRSACLEFAKWLRKEYVFPVRVPIYLHSVQFVKTSDGDTVDGYFFEPTNYAWEPYICVAAGRYESLVLTEGSYGAIACVLITIAHELTHYFQWINGVKLTEIGIERQAANYANSIVWEYLLWRYKELYTVGVWSILGCSDAPAVIEVLETDRFNRVLFKFNAYTPFYSDANGRWLNAFVICQKFDGERAYYYADACFVIITGEQEADESKISQLKKINDWNDPIDAAKLTGKRIVSYRRPKIFEHENDASFGKTLSPEELFAEYVEIGEYENVLSEKSDEDKYGRSLYYFRTFKRSAKGQDVIYVNAYVMIVDPDGSYERDTFLTKLDDAYAYNDQLAAFKALNHWDESMFEVQCPEEESAGE